VSGQRPMRMREKKVLRVVGKGFIPFILLFALYVQFHGDFGPGGGFQAGVIFAAGLILYGLIFGLQDLKRVAPTRVVEIFAALGVLVYGGTGVLTVLLGSNFLEYSALSHDPAHGQHYGLLAIEGGVGITVTAAMLTIFYMFAGRKLTADEQPGEQA
jgi:multicomponent Na+:H+ antiporter subunit B